VPPVVADLRENGTDRAATAAAAAAAERSASEQAPVAEDREPLGRLTV
jgi:hypothetical protein